jgi:hypothetical protein
MFHSGYLRLNVLLRNVCGLAKYQARRLMKALHINAEPPAPRILSLWAIEGGEMKNRNGGVAEGMNLQAAANRLRAGGTQIAYPEAFTWTKQPLFPEKSLENAVLEGSLTEDGHYLTLVKWYPGYMSAPHTYATDRICVVVSGTWWINCGPEFDSKNSVPMPPGSFVRRVARTPHYDGVIAEGVEPAIVAICGLSPVDVKLVDPSKPGWRKV